MTEQRALAANSKAVNDPRLVEQVTESVDSGLPVLYLSGSITDAGTEKAQEKFSHEKQRLKEAGYMVISPLDYPPATEIGWIACMQRDIGLLGGCDAVALIGDQTGTMSSHGVKMEIEAALHEGKQIRSVSDWVILSVVKKVR